MGYWQSAMRTIKDADVVVFVRDARMPEISRNIDLEEKLKRTGKEVLMVFNKIDLIPVKNLRKLQKENRGCFFVSTLNRKGINYLRLKLQMLAKSMKVDKLEVGIVGYPNIGKSALTNVLTRSAKAKVSSKAGTTTSLQWIAGTKIKILDSPGVIPIEDDEVKLGMIGAKNPEKIKNPELVAMKIIDLFIQGETKNLEEKYKISIDSEDDNYEIFVKIGESRSPLKKGGVIDERFTALLIIKDWQTGKLRLN